MLEVLKGTLQREQQERVRDLQVGGEMSANGLSSDQTGNFFYLKVSKEVGKR